MEKLERIIKLIDTAGKLEMKHPDMAHGWYETAERELYEALLIKGIINNAEFSDYFAQIMSGYNRLNAAKETHASSL